MTAIEWLRLIAGSLFLLTGLVIFFSELFGVFRFDYALNRMHAAAMGDTLGLGSCLVGLMIFSGLNFTTLKIFLIITFFWLASPVSAHMLSSLEVATNEALAEHCEVYDDISVLEAELAAKKAREAAAGDEGGGYPL